MSKTLHPSPNTYLIARVISDTVGKLGHERVEKRRLFHHHLLREERVLTAAALDSVRRKGPGSSHKPDQRAFPLRFFSQSLSMMPRIST